MNSSPPKRQPFSVQPAGVGQEELTLHFSAAGLQTCMAWFHHLEQARRGELSILQHWTDDVREAAQTMAKTTDPADLMARQAELFGASVAHALKLHGELTNSWQCLHVQLVEDCQVNTQIDSQPAFSAGSNGSFANAGPVQEQTLKWVESVRETTEQMALGWAAVLQPHGQAPG